MPYLQVAQQIYLINKVDGKTIYTISALKPA